MELHILGKENIVLIEVVPTELLGKKETGDTYPLVQRILNAYINYLGNIARKRTNGAVFIEYCLLKILPFFYCLSDILFGLGGSFSVSRWSF